LSLCAAINRTLDSGINLTDPEFFKDITEEKLDAYLMGQDNVPCPMIPERVRVLREVSEVLISKYQGSFANCLQGSGKSAQTLLKTICDDFPCFRDTAEFAGRRVAILKRAQILVADIWALFSGKDLGQFDDIDTITMFADYRVPQSLQYFGAFEYSQQILDVLKKDEILANGSEYEVEIRGCSIEAVIRLVEETKRLLEEKAGGNEGHQDGKVIKVNSILADYFLWGFRREKAEDMKQFPYHKVRSVYY